jgi:hypothetical protein
MAALGDVDSSYGCVVFFDATAVESCDWGGGLDPDGDLDELYKRRICAAVEVDQEAACVVEIVDALPSHLKGFSQAELQLLSGELSIGALYSLHEGATAVHTVVPGRYRLTMWRVGVRLLVHLASVSAFVMRPPAWCLGLDSFGAPPDAATGSTLELLGAKPGELEGIAADFGRAALRFGGEAFGAWSVGDGMAFPVNHLEVDEAQARAGMLVFVGAEHYPAGEGVPAPMGPATLTMWSLFGEGEIWARVCVDPKTHALRQLHVRLEGLSEKVRQSFVDRVRAAMQPVVPLPATEEPLDVQMEWTPDKLTLRLAHAEGKKPKLTVHLLGDGGDVVEALVAYPLDRVQGWVIYEVWLLGRRAGVRRAAAYALRA